MSNDTWGKQERWVAKHTTSTHKRYRDTGNHTGDGEMLCVRKGRRAGLDQFGTTRKEEGQGMAREKAGATTASTNATFK
ncbi:uncharacterized protein SPSK_10188 [Sporothrix schenckii 1099-18]|uniref:Uncharacterized protein n=1 Tax=Sporothrix schenckii 1099-18 TaxID=1397361 RepID=A0A0F2M5X1_SPOSC|nr:uncharacterized protein SPSK_10188 [Sporothrix schenckii 1099-18]KJR85027.1 hypothetical protein SPSK_10188 [Sporothrix schenckii 1099-18]